jgi:hypothetical protein
MPGLFQRSMSQMTDGNRPDCRAPQRATGRHVNLYIIERLYDEIKLSNGVRSP